jgi:hypothetical protein
MSAALLLILDSLRSQGNQIPIWDWERRRDWFIGMAEILAELPHEDQRMAWVALIANDLCRRIPGLSLSVAAAPLLDRLKAMKASWI